MPKGVGWDELFAGLEHKEKINRHQACGLSESLHRVLMHSGSSGRICVSGGRCRHPLPRPRFRRVHESIHDNINQRASPCPAAISRGWFGQMLTGSAQRCGELIMGQFSICIDHAHCRRVGVSAVDGAMPQ